MPEITQYERENGIIPFQKWFDSLGVKAALKIRTAIAQMEVGNFGDHKSVGGGVLERRINFEKGYRIYFAKDGDQLVLLFLGGTKSRQQLDVEKAKSYWAEYKARKKQIAETQKPKDQQSKSKKTPKKSTRKK